MTKLNVSLLQELNNNIEKSIEIYDKIIEELEEDDGAKRMYLAPSFIQELLEISIGRDLVKLKEKTERLMESSKYE